MSTLIHNIETITTDYSTVRTRVDEVAGQFIVSCNGSEVGHECSGAVDFAIEDGDTWGSDDTAVMFAELHAEEHFKREARP